ncbi:hypothetical protein D3C85_1415230 [compost metagenome]
MAIEVDFHQIRRRDFIKHQPIRVDQKMMLRPRNTHRDVSEDQVGHTEMRHQPIAGGEFFAQTLFGRAHTLTFTVQASSP